MKSWAREFWIWKPLAVAGALAFMYSGVIWKLGYDWWTDDNYSHGLVIPFVIAYIVAQRFERLKAEAENSSGWWGWILVTAAAFLLIAGTLASVLVAQRISLVLMLVGIIAWFFGTRVLKRLSMPLLLFILAIPIPQMLFNKIAFPLQLLASRVAEKGIRLLGIAADRIGNVIEIPNRATGEIIGLEVVEACSGIRSLMTLITLALILGYFTRERRERLQNGLIGLASDRDIQRTALLMAAAVPIALITNAARVVVTGVIAYHFGHGGVEGSWHDVSGSIVFAAALLLLFGLNVLLKKLLATASAEVRDPNLLPDTVFPTPTISAAKTAPVVLVILLFGGVVNWFQYRGELHVGRRPLREIPARLGSWEQRNEDIRFDPETEEVLRATDYVMRDYYGPGKRLNLYIGYYDSQRSGATYHSPLSCLPGTGWEMTDPQLVEVQSPGGRTFTVNRYIVKRGEHREYLIYWYHGRGRTFANEYQDKLYTSLDSVTMRRSDGGMVRIMTPLGKDPDRSLAAAIDLTTHVADNISDFLPD